MKTLTPNMWKKGMKVVLVNPDPVYQIGLSNPMHGTDYFCEGVIVAIYSLRTAVKWDNGFTNEYKNNELSKVETIQYISIWKKNFDG